jgi:UDP:flavonoid glycosyltransferase YjiC (YdhE family)
MRILIIATGCRGDVQPDIALDKGLRDAKLDLKMGFQTQLK